MKDQIALLEDSFRTNIAMSKSMVKLGLMVLARSYLNNAKKDKRMLTILKTKWDLDATDFYQTEV